MKSQRPAHLLRLTLLLLAFAISASTMWAGQPTTPEKLGKAFVKAIRKNNEKALEKLLVSKTDLLWVLDKAEVPEEQKTEMRNMLETSWVDIKAKVRDRHIRNMHEQHSENELGVQWKKLKLLDIRVVSEKVEDGLDICDVLLTCTDGRQKIGIHLREAGHVERGWVLAGEPFEVGLLEN